MIASLFIIEHVHAYFISVENRQQDPDEFLPAVDEGTHEHQAFYRLKEAVLDKDACHEFTYPDEIKALLQHKGFRLPPDVGNTMAQTIRFMLTKEEGHLFFSGVFADVIMHIVRSSFTVFTDGAYKSGWLILDEVFSHVFLTSPYTSVNGGIW